MSGGFQECDSLALFYFRWGLGGGGMGSEEPAVLRNSVGHSFMKLRLQVYENVGFTNRRRLSSGTSP